MIAKEILKELYIDRKLSSRKVVKKFNYSKATILKWLHYYNIPVREVKKTRIGIPKDRLTQLYINRKLSIYKIAEILNVDPVVIHNRMREYGIPARSISEALKGRIPWNKGKNLSDKTKKKLSKIWKKFWRNPEFKEKMAIRNKKLSERMKGGGNPMKNLELRKKRNKKMIGKLVGDKNPARKIKVRRKISKALKGHEVPPLVRKKIAKSLIGRYVGELNPFYGRQHTEAVKRKNRIKAIKQLISGKFRNKITSIELKIERELRKRNIYYKKQFPLLNRTIVDFYVPRHGVVIYCDGTFWHKSEWAKKEGVMRKDKNQTKILSDNGYKVFRFPEEEINNSPKKCIGKITEYINKI